MDGILSPSLWSMTSKRANSLGGPFIRCFLTWDSISDQRVQIRGSTDDKGPVLGWVNVLQAHKELGIPLPVNLKFCFEGMEETGSEGLDELIVKEAKGFFKNVDAVCIVSAAFVFSVCVLMYFVAAVGQLLAE